MFTRYMMQCFPSFRCKQATRQTQTQHKRIQTLQFFCSTFFSPVAVILQIHAMKFYKRLVIFANSAGMLIEQTFFKRSAQTFACFFYSFNW
jgi:hypothetical protein